jgi:biopolymer transport protein ExbD
MARKGRRPRWRLPQATGGSVNLISMMDILTVLLLFLLKSYVSGGEVMVPPPGIALPTSNAEQLPQTSLVVAIDHSSINVGGEAVVSVADAIRGNRLEIDALAQKLQIERRQQDEIARLRGEDVNQVRAATIQGDREIEFRVLQRVMFTLNQNGYEDIALAVLQAS